MTKPTTAGHFSGSLLLATVLLVNAGCGSTGSKSPHAQQVGAPNQLNAAHILIMHNESPRRPAHIRRTKAEALKRAQEVAAKAQANGADFAALAKEYSDGPTSTRGGNLGNFAPDKMVKPFSDATQQLKIGEVSGPVETQFGFHIILRKAPT